MKIISTNPSRNYEVIAEVEATSPAGLDAKVALAKAAQQAWSELDLEERIKAMESFTDAMRERAEDLAHTISLETGRPIVGARLDVAKGIECFDAYLATAEEHLAPVITLETDSEVHRVFREPWGVIAAICPWNFPTTNVAWQCGQALIAGNVVVYKNSEENPLFSQLIEEIIASSELPEHVFSVVYGDGIVGEMLACSAIDRLSFTGSFAVGRKLAVVAAEKFIPFTAELGGSNPYILFEGTEVTDALIANIYGRRFLHSGQFCTSLKRLIVHESLFDEVVTKLAAVASAKKIGDALDESTDLGPVVAQRQLKTLEKQVNDSVAMGAKVICGAQRPDGLLGAYYEPTILVDVTRDMSVWNQETFGPVLPVVAFSNESEAIELANDTEYGLSAFISTPDKEQFARVARKLKAGMIAENQVINLQAGYNPFGGYKHSGMGRENGVYGFHEVTQIKLISEEK